MTEPFELLPFVTGLFRFSLLVPLAPLLYNRRMTRTVLLRLAVLLAVSSTASWAESPGRATAPSGHVGAAMAVLATLEDADVLPLGATPEANRVIKIVIQFQSVFLKSDDAAVGQFLDHALTAKWADHAGEVRARFHHSGWTSEVLEALEAHYGSLPDRDRQALAPGFGKFNVTTGDFDYLLDLFRKARMVYRGRGQDIHQAFAARRQQMPGSHS